MRRTLASLRRQRVFELLIRNVLLFCAVLSVFITAAIILSLLFNSVNFFRQVSLFEFLTGTVWTPLFANPKFGILPLVAGSLIVTLCAVVVALPFGLGSAIYLSEYAKPRAKKLLKPVLEILAGIPSIVYGYFAITFIIRNPPPGGRSSPY